MARPRGTKLWIVAAEACGAVFGPTGTKPRRVVRLPTADSLCSLKVARASKISADGNFRRPLVGSLRACSSAKMAAPMCIAAARIGFLLAALHSVAERVNPRKVRPPAPHWPRVLASAVGPHLPLLGEESRASRAQPEPERLSLGVFSTPGDMPRWLENGNGTADRGGGGVRCGLRANGDNTRRVVRLPTADSLCDRMERGEEEASTGRRDAYRRNHFGRR